MTAQRLLWWLMPLALVALMFGAIACGGDDDDDNGGNGGDAGQEDDDDGGGVDGDDDGDDGDADDDGDDADSDGDGADSDGGDDDDGAGDDDDGDSDGGGSSGSGGDDSEDGLSFLRQTAGALEDSTYFVTYAMSADGLDGTFTFASKPPLQLFGLEGEFEGESGIIQIINDQEFLWFCSDFEGEQGCIKFAAGGAGAFPIPFPTALQTDELADSILNSPGVTAESAPGQSIAGIDADCWDVTTEGETVLICIGEGTILKLEGTFEGSDFSMEAQQVELDADDIEIAVPDWPVQDLSSAGG
jgi:hypothetical protein